MTSTAPSSSWCAVWLSTETKLGVLSYSSCDGRFVNILWICKVGDDFMTWKWNKVGHWACRKNCVTLAWSPPVLRCSATTRLLVASLRCCPFCCSKRRKSLLWIRRLFRTVSSVPRRHRANCPLACVLPLYKSWNRGGRNGKNWHLNVYSLACVEVIRIEIPKVARIVETRTAYRVLMGNISRDGRVRRR
jgi:hypothetical protein